MDTSMAHSAMEVAHVGYYFYPLEARCMKEVKKGELTLLPTTDMARMCISPTSSNIRITSSSSGEAIAYIDSPPTPRSGTSNGFKKDVVMAAFWHVKTTSTPSEANFKMTKLKVGDYTIPAYENSKVLKPFDKLMVLDAGTAKAPPSKKAKAAAKASA